MTSIAYGTRENMKTCLLAGKHAYWLTKSIIAVEITGKQFSPVWWITCACDATTPWNANKRKISSRWGKWSQIELDLSRHSISWLCTSWVILLLLPNVSFSLLLPDSRSVRVLRPVFPSSVLDGNSLMEIPVAIASSISSTARLLSIMYASMPDATATWRKKINNNNPTKRTRFPANWRVLSYSRGLSSLQDVASSVNRLEGSDHHRFANL